MRHQSTLFFIGLISLLAGGCSDERLGGNTTQTENTLARIRVDSLLPDWNHPTKTTTVATLRLDSSNFNFELPDSGGSDLSVEMDDGQPIPFYVTYWDKAGRKGRMQVRIDTSLLHPKAHFLVRWIQSLKPRGNAASVWQSLPDSQRMAIGSVLVDDFEGGSLNSRLPDTTGWYKAASDSLIPLTGPTLVAAGAGRSGKAIHLGYNTTSANGNYALLGIFLVKVGGTANLRSLDSVVFFVRGPGKLAFALDRLPPHTKSKAWIHRTLDSTWTRLRIRPQDFDTADGTGNNFGWNALRDSVTNMSFMVADGKDLYVDDIRFYGVDRDDLK